MTANSDTAIQVNFKTMAGTLVNLYAHDGEHLDVLLGEYLARVKTVYEIEQMIQAVGAVAPLQGAPGAPPQSAEQYGGGNVVPINQGQQATANAHPKGKTCDKCAMAGRPGVGYRFGAQGTNAKGQWTRWDCLSGDRDHVDWGR